MNEPDKKQFKRELRAWALDLIDAHAKYQLAPIVLRNLIISRKLDPLDLATALAAQAPELEEEVKARCEEWEREA